ncbi:MAG: hypothetical protein M3Z11_10625 [Candidatus Dormibacteraeota bacterium]|nr:hypothetical protein [Candidatus Dormibacteraeota bacterium]
MRILKLATAAAVAGAGAVVISGTAFATTASPAPTVVPAAAAGALTIALTCDTGRTGSAVFVVTANGKSSTATVKCGGSSAVSNAAWKAGSKASIHQSSAATGAVRTRDLSVTLKATAQSVSIRNFKAATVQTASQAATLAQTGGGLPMAPIGAGLLGLLLATVGTRLIFARR